MSQLPLVCTVQSSHSGSEHKTGSPALSHLSLLSDSHLCIICLRRWGITSNAFLHLILATAGSSRPAPSYSLGGLRYPATPSETLFLLIPHHLHDWSMWILATCNRTNLGVKESTNILLTQGASNSDKELHLLQEIFSSMKLLIFISDQLRYISVIFDYHQRKVEIKKSYRNLQNKIPCGNPA